MDNRNNIKKEINQWLESLTIPKKPNEFEVKQILKRMDIHVPDGIIVKNTSEIDLTDMEPPYVVKICSSDIHHKTELGGVLLNLNKDEVTDTIDKLSDKFMNSSFLIERQLKFSTTEFIIGGILDPVFGAAIMVGAGGILTEIYKDVSFRLVPCSKDDAVNMLDELLISPILNGYRGLKINKDALALILFKISGFIELLGSSFSQLDLNPIVFDGDKWCVLDAKLFLK